MGTTGGDVEAGFAKLQGEDFEYYMQTYSIILGRNSKKSTVDVDLASLGGGMNISRHHARIFYDFTRRRFALEVLGKNGCLVEGVLHLPGNPPVKLDSQDLLQIGDKEFYFLLPVRSILGGHVGPRHYVAGTKAGPVVPHYNYHSGAETGRIMGAVAGVKKGSGRELYDEYEDEEDVGSSSKKLRREGYEGYSYGTAGSGEKKLEGRSRIERESDSQQLLILEEKDVVSSVATVLSDLCGPGEWMPVEKLHAELVELYGTVWHHSRVRRYLTSKDWSGPESKGKPWCGLLTLLRKYPEYFVINTRSTGRVTLEFVSLVSLVS
ncbi:forkhead-associated domain-containing family protein [Tripterygium wilfordii]|uniref:Forkhead-associated domain-containing family protein n=1 Tax=Tripterygium wilfordii TaxID=458696 RepID=A0A7J7BY84_TRIWF|nr:FHA domain-containing protein FHA2-like isoform X2 [Tripterygium wilfordii]KAF5726577.1 forkhead-associated domain-containing family protein [Tripterygium wilfordii]